MPELFHRVAWEDPLTTDEEKQSVLQFVESRMVFDDCYHYVNGEKDKQPTGHYRGFTEDKRLICHIVYGHFRICMIMANVMTPKCFRIAFKDCW